MKKSELAICINKLMSGDLQVLEALYNHYYYIAEKYYKRYDLNNQKRAKIFAEETLKQAILDFKDYKEYYKYPSIVKFIYNKFENFDNKLLNADQFNIKNITSLIYNEDYQDRVEIFISKSILIEKYARKFYEYSLDYQRKILSNKELEVNHNNYCESNNIIDIEDVYQNYYLEAWKVINRYYDNNNYKTDFSLYLLHRLQRYTAKQLELLKKRYEINQRLEDLKPLNMDLEPSNIIINNAGYKRLCKKFNELDERGKYIIINYINGKSYTDIANQLEITPQAVQDKARRTREKLKLKLK